ncbi:MAG: M28 family peptidase [Planctomycetes bacterium]|nr:M28 family peptidase [Planctomycetota bacterium]
MFNFHRVLRFTVLIVLAACLGWSSGCRTQSTVGPTRATGRSASASDIELTRLIPLSTVSSEPIGRIVPGPANIRGFRPAESLTTVDARNINLRKVFEDLGEDATLWYQHVQTLANPFFEGRSAGSRGFEIATEYVEFYLREYSLEPAFTNAQELPGGETDAAWVSFQQPFTYGGSQRRTFDLTGEYLAINGEPLEHRKDFVVLAQSGGEQVTAPLTFVGYGIEEGEEGYRSFDEDTNLTGRVALVLRYEPLDEQGKSRWARRNFSRHAAMPAKLQALVDRGAEAIILVTPPGAVDGKKQLESLISSGRFGDPLDIPVVQIAPEVADRILAEADPEGRDLATWRGRADAGEVTSAPLSDDLPITVGGQANMVVTRQSYESANVGGVLRGGGELADQWIVIGGHLDHVGYGGRRNSMPSQRGQVHPGADDNASGTAGMLVLAKRFSKLYAEAGDDADLRSILFVAFGAEEAGLRGSAHYVANPTISPGQITLMINMDMIGRVRSNELLIGGTGSAQEFDDLLATNVIPSGLIVHASATGRGPSDHSNFYGEDIPVLFFFSGLHAEYHRPGDHAYTVNPIGAIKVIDLVDSIVREVASRPEPLTFRQTAGRSPSGRDRTGASVQLGIVPKYDADLDTGVFVDEIVQGTSADLAGVKAGDVLVAWDGEELTGLRRMMQLLREHKPGDVVAMTIRRDGAVITVDVELKARDE